MEICFTLVKNSPDVIAQPSKRRFSPNRNPLLYLVALIFITSAAHSQPSTKYWDFSVVVDGYLVPDDVSYGNPTFTAERDKLHLEARYNYEDLNTGSLWVGYIYDHDFGASKNLNVRLISILGGVFGRTSGVAPGCELTVTYKKKRQKLELFFSNEYVFASTGRPDSYYYAWPQLTYSPLEWLKVGAVAQQTKAYQTEVDFQRGFLVGVSHKDKVSERTLGFTTYVFNPGIATPTVVLEASYEF